MGSLKVPVLQVSKEYQAQNHQQAFKDACEVVLKDARQTLLQHSLTLKKEELRFLKSLLSEPELQSAVDKTIARVDETLHKLYTTGEGNKAVTSPFYKEEHRVITTHGISLCRKAIALGFHRYQRELVGKTEKLSLKNNTDTQMRDASATSVEKTIELAVARALKAQQTKHSSPSKSKSSVSTTLRSTSDFTPRKRQSTSEEEEDFSSQEGSSSEERAQVRKRKSRRRNQEEKHSEEINTLLHSVRGLNPTEVFLSPAYCLAGLESRISYGILQSSLNAVDSFTESSAAVFKGPGVSLPREYEQHLSYNGKYIFHSKPDKQLVLNALSDVERTIRLKWIFQDKEDKPFNLKFYVKSDWTPPTRDIRLEFAISKTRDYVKKQLSGLRLPESKPNLNSSKLCTFLRGNRYLIKITDKNLGLSVVTADWYMEQVEKHLSNRNAYTPIHEFDKTSLFEEFETLLRKYFWTATFRKWLSTTVVELPTFYVIPKVHKEPWASRPIVPSHSWITSRASEIVDYFFQKQLPKYPWILNSTKQFVEGIRKLPDLHGCWLVTGDVTAMYTNIPPEEAYYLICPLLEENDLEGLHPENIEALLQFVLRTNYFEYEGTVYQQISGLAMGTACAPIIANLYCAQFETSLMDSPALRYYARYIDDIFLVYQGSEEELQEFLQTIQLGPLEITWEYSEKKLHFLDVQVFSVNDRLTTSIYRKFLNKYMYIPYSSAHPLSVKKAFIKAERSRIRLLCSEDSDFAEKEHFFFLNLLRRGYPESLLSKLFNLPLKNESSRGDENTKGKILFKSSYNPIWEYINVFKIGQEFQNQAALAGLTLPDSLRKDFLLGLKRTRNFYDLFNTSNLIILNQESTFILPSRSQINDGKANPQGNSST